MPRIYITEPNHFYTFELPVVPGAEVLIGTAPHCQLALPGVAGLGEVHACISCQPQGYVIADLGSPTGTFANGVPIRSEFLRPGVEYRLGAAVIALEGAQQTAPPQQPMGAAMPQPMPQPAVAQAAAAAAPAGQAAGAKPAVAKKKASPLKTGAAAAANAGKGGKKDLSNLAAKFDRNRGKGASQATFVYVIVLLVVAFYAGIALHHWERTGNFLPGLVADEQGEPVPAVASAPVAEGAAVEEAPAEETPTDDAPVADDEPPMPEADEAEENEPTEEEPTPEADTEAAEAGDEGQED